MEYDTRNYSRQDSWNQHWYDRCWEVIVKYDPDMFNNDSPYPRIGTGKGLGIKLFTEYLNRGLKENNGNQTVILSFKNGNADRRAFTYNLDRGSAADIKPEPWIWATDLSGGWFYRKGAVNRMSTSVMVGNAVDAIGKNGVVMLNVALRGDGTLPENQAAYLTTFGECLKINGEEFSAYGTRKEDGGVALVEVPRASEAVRCRLQENDLVQAVNSRRVSNSGQLFKTLAELDATQLKISVVRNQQVSVLEVSTGAHVEVETSDAVDGFANLPLPSSPSGKVAANQSTANQPVENLVDGRLVRDYGPVFRNGVRSGAYKTDLGQPKAVTAVSSWSFSQNGKRGSQRVTIYGSGSAIDPGWDLRDRDRFKPLGTIDTTGLSAGTFNAASLRVRNGRSLGQFRWIIWSVSPVTTLAENTAFRNCRSRCPSSPRGRVPH